MSVSGIGHPHRSECRWSWRSPTRRLDDPLTIEGPGGTRLDQTAALFLIAMRLHKTSAPEDGCRPRSCPSRPTASELFKRGARPRMPDYSDANDVRLLRPVRKPPLAPMCRCAERGLRGSPRMTPLKPPVGNSVQVNCAQSARSTISSGANGAYAREGGPTSSCSTSAAVHPGGMNGFMRADSARRLLKGRRGSSANWPRTLSAVT